MEKILKSLEPLFQHTPPLLVVIGLALFIIGAAGGSESLHLTVSDPLWRIAMAAMGTVVASFGGLLMWRESTVEKPSVVAKKCDLKITAQTTVGDEIRLVGTFKKNPPDNSVVIIEKALIRQEYFFQPAPYFHQKELQWSGNLRVGSGERVLYIGILGKSGQSLRDYYLLVHQKTGKWVGMRDLPSDFVRCDDVKVTRK
jgi:hypothetical protein